MNDIDIWFLLILLVVVISMFGFVYFIFTLNAHDDGDPPNGGAA